MGHDVVAHTAHGLPLRARSECVATPEARPIRAGKAISRGATLRCLAPRIYQGNVTGRCLIAV
jgi:hypothetical protein